VESMEDAVRRLMRDGTTPSKRANKNRSGRTGRKQWQTQQAQQRAGGLGYVRSYMEGPEGVFRNLCMTVPRQTGFDSDGVPFRSPNDQRSSGAQRGQ